MSTHKQLGPALFNIGSDIQMKMVESLLDKDGRFGYKESDLKDLWEKTQEDFVSGRAGSIYKYDKLFKKKKPPGTSKVFYENKLKLDYKKVLSGKDLKINQKITPSVGTVPWSVVNWDTGDYGKYQTMINCFLYKLNKNDYYEWALDTDKFGIFVNAIKDMYTSVPKGDQIGRDIAKNNDKFKIEARSGLIEASLNITRQCKDSCGSKPKKGENVKCYICGEEIDTDSGEEASGSQCEHVVPVTSLAALCGLSGPDYEKTIDAFFLQNSDKNGDVDAEGYKITRAAYKLWRKNLLGDTERSARSVGALNDGGGDEGTGVMYRWAHPGCNMIKKDHAFLALDWTSPKDDAEWDEMKKVGFPLLDQTDYCDKAGINYVLNCLSNRAIGGVKGGGGVNSKHWRDRFWKGKNKTDPQTKKWVEERYKVMEQKTMHWAMCAVLSIDISPTGRFKDQYEGRFNDKIDKITEDMWPSFRTALCDLSMRILDFRVEEKIKTHYEKYKKATVTSADLQGLVEEWRKAEWIDLVGADGDEDSQDGGARGKNYTALVANRRKGKVGYETDKTKKSKNVKLSLAYRQTILSSLSSQTFSTMKEHRDWSKAMGKGNSFDLLKELNDSKLLLPIYFDVFDTVTEPDQRVCRAETYADNYRENFMDYVDFEALVFEKAVAEGGKWRHTLGNRSRGKRRPDKLERSSKRGRRGSYYEESSGDREMSLSESESEISPGSYTSMEGSVSSASYSKTKKKTRGKRHRKTILNRTHKRTKKTKRRKRVTGWASFF